MDGFHIRDSFALEPLDQRAPGVVGAVVVVGGGGMRVVALHHELGSAPLLEMPQHLHCCRRYIDAALTLLGLGFEVLGAADVDQAFLSIDLFPSEKIGLLAA